MTDGELLKQFHADFEKLKHNRDQVPLDILTTRYAAGYNAQVAKVQEGADWFFSNSSHIEITATAQATGYTSSRTRTKLPYLKEETQ